MPEITDKLKLEAIRGLWERYCKMYILASTDNIIYTIIKEYMEGKLLRELIYVYEIKTLEELLLLLQRVIEEEKRESEVG